MLQRVNLCITIILLLYLTPSLAIADKPDHQHTRQTQAGVPTENSSHPSLSSHPKKNAFNIRIGKIWNGLKTMVSALCCGCCIQTTEKDEAADSQPAGTRLRTNKVWKQPDKISKSDHTRYQMSPAAIEVAPEYIFRQASEHRQISPPVSTRGNSRDVMQRQQMARFSQATKASGVTPYFCLTEALEPLLHSVSPQDSCFTRLTEQLVLVVLSSCIHPEKLLPLVNHWLSVWSLTNWFNYSPQTLITLLAACSQSGQISILCNPAFGTEQFQNLISLLVKAELAHQGDKKCDYLRKAIVIQPDHPLPYLKLMEQLQKENQYQQACAIHAMYQLTITLNPEWHTTLASMVDIDTAGTRHQYRKQSLLQHLEICFDTTLWALGHTPYFPARHNKLCWTKLESAIESWPVSYRNALISKLYPLCLAVRSTNEQQVPGYHLTECALGLYDLHPLNPEAPHINTLYQWEDEITGLLADLSKPDTKKRHALGWILYRWSHINHQQEVLQVRQQMMLHWLQQWPASQWATLNPRLFVSVLAALSHTKSGRAENNTRLIWLETALEKFPPAAKKMYQQLVLSSIPSQASHREFHLQQAVLANYPHPLPYLELMKYWVQKNQTEKAWHVFNLYRRYIVYPYSHGSEKKYSPEDTVDSGACSRFILEDHFANTLKVIIRHAEQYPHCYESNSIMYFPTARTLQASMGVLSGT